MSPREKTPKMLFPPASELWFNSEYRPVTRNRRLSKGKTLMFMVPWRRTIVSSFLSRPPSAKIPSSVLKGPFSL